MAKRSNPNPYLASIGTSGSAAAPVLPPNPMLGFALMMGKCNPIFRNCLLYHLGKATLPICPPPTFFMTKAVAGLLAQYPDNFQQAFLLALGVTPEGEGAAEATGVASRATTEAPEEVRALLANTEEFAQAFDALGRETHGQGAQALEAMLSLMQSHPGLKISLSY